MHGVGRALCAAVELTMSRASVGWRLGVPRCHVDGKRTMASPAEEVSRTEGKRRPITSFTSHLCHVGACQVTLGAKYGVLRGTFEEHTR